VRVEVLDVKSRHHLAILVLSCFFLCGCSVLKLASVAGKAAKAGSATVKVTKATSTAAKAGTATKVAGTGAVTVMAHADDAFRVSRLADDANAFVLVGSELPKASKPVRTFEVEDLEPILTALEVADFVSSNWNVEADYELGQDGPEGMKEALEAFPSIRAISGAMAADDRYWTQWVRLPEGDRLVLFEPESGKVALLEPQQK
jgi:hypothetical protein